MRIFIRTLLFFVLAPVFLRPARAADPCDTPGQLLLKMHAILKAKSTVRPPNYGFDFTQSIDRFKNLKLFSKSEFPLPRGRGVMSREYAEISPDEIRKVFEVSKWSARDQTRFDRFVEWGGQIRLLEISSDGEKNFLPEGPYAYFREGKPDPVTQIKMPIIAVTAHATPSVVVHELSHFEYDDVSFLNSKRAKDFAQHREWDERAAVVAGLRNRVDFAAGSGAKRGINHYADEPYALRYGSYSKREAIRMLFLTKPLTQWSPADHLRLKEEVAALLKSTAHIFRQWQKLGKISNEQLRNPDFLFEKLYEIDTATGTGTHLDRLSPEEEALVRSLYRQAYEKTTKSP